MFWGEFAEKSFDFCDGTLDVADEELAIEGQGAMENIEETTEEAEEEE